MTDVSWLFYRIEAHIDQHVEAYFCCTVPSIFTTTGDVLPVGLGTFSDLPQLSVLLERE